MKKSILLFSMILPFFVFSQNISSITPNSAAQGQTLSLVISGNNMQFSGWSCWSQSGNISDFRFFQSGGANPMNGTPISSTATQLDGYLIVPAFQPTGVYDLEVFNGSNCNWVLFPNSFQINAAAVASWDCMNGACIDPGTGNGTYTSLSACQTACVVVTETWDCISPGNCQESVTGTGTYASLSACQANCNNVSVVEIGLTNFKIFPNPSSDLFNISFSSNEVQDLRVRVLNSISEEVLIIELNQFYGVYSKQINLTNNAKGIYFLEIENNNGVINKKLILQ